MKIDRILGIIIYLLNHDRVSAKTLAEKYHVSVRTIQRDMVNIASSGIPIYSDSGKNGGYSILPTYKLKNNKQVKEFLKNWDRNISFIAEEYPAIQDEPKLFTRYCTKIFPTEIKLCCKILGIE